MILKIELKINIGFYKIESNFAIFEQLCIKYITHAI